jgi:hypothetical protein
LTAGECYDEQGHEAAIGEAAVKKTFLIATALMTGAFSSVAAQTESSVLQSLPAEVQKEIEDVRAACREIQPSTLPGASEVTSGDSGLIQFLLGGRKAVLVDDIVLCGDCYKGTNCSNRGTRHVRVCALFGNAWRKVPFLEDAAITGDIFVSYVPGKYRPEGQKLNALVVDLFRQQGVPDAPRWLDVGAVVGGAQLRRALERDQVHLQAPVNAWGTAPERRAERHRARIGRTLR